MPTPWRGMQLMCEAPNFCLTADYCRGLQTAACACGTFRVVLELSCRISNRAVKLSTPMSCRTVEYCHRPAQHPAPMRWTNGCGSVIEGHASWAGSAYVLPDGRILSWSDNILRLWDVENGVCLAVLEGRVKRTELNSYLMAEYCRGRRTVLCACGTR